MFAGASLAALIFANEMSEGMEEAEAIDGGMVVLLCGMSCFPHWDTQVKIRII